MTERTEDRWIQQLQAADPIGKERMLGIPSTPRMGGYDGHGAVESRYTAYRAPEEDEFAVRLPGHEDWTPMTPSEFIRLLPAAAKGVVRALRTDGDKVIIRFGWMDTGLHKFIGKHATKTIAVRPGRAIEVEARLIEA